MCLYVVFLQKGIQDSRINGSRVVRVHATHMDILHFLFCAVLPFNLLSSLKSKLYNYTILQ